MHICVWLSPFAVHLKLSQHYLLICYTPTQNKKLKKWCLSYDTEVAVGQDLVENPIFATLLEDFGQHVLSL